MSIVKEITKIDSSKKKLREFGLVVGGVLSAIGYFLWWREKGSELYFLFPGTFLVVCGILAPSILKPFQKAWMTLAVLMGWVMTRVILSALFYVAITPIGWILRVTGKDLLDQRPEPSKQSFWKVLPKASRIASDYEKQF